MASKSHGPALKPIHPFPARMEPSLILERLGEIDENSRMLDPMTDSGVVLRHAIEVGNKAMGFDLDPLSVLTQNAY